MTTETCPQNMGGGSGHSASPLFTRLPAEIRLSIYRETFVGSVTTLCVLPFSREDRRNWESPYFINLIVPVEPTGMPSSYAHNAQYVEGVFDAYRQGGTWDTSCSHHQLLLTCRQIYDEAMHLYWSETLVCNGEDHWYYFNRKYFVKRVPDIAKKYVRRIYGIRFEGGSNEIHMPFAEFLSHFPRLEVCRMHDWILRIPSPSPRRIEPYDPIWGQRCLDYAGWYGFPENLWKELVVPSHKAVVVQKWIYRLDRDNLVARNEKVCAHNYFLDTELSSAGRTFHSINHIYCRHASSTTRLKRVTTFRIRPG